MAEGRLAAARDFWQTQPAPSRIDHRLDSPCAYLMGDDQEL
jgi:hypothetical protein